MSITGWRRPCTRHFRSSAARASAAVPPPPSPCASPARPCTPRAASVGRGRCSAFPLLHRHALPQEEEPHDLQANAGDELKLLTRLAGVELLPPPGGFLARPAVHAEEEVSAHAGIIMWRWARSTN